MTDRQAHANLLRAAVKGLHTIKHSRHFTEAEELLEEAIRDSAAALMVPVPIAEKPRDWSLHALAALCLLFLAMALWGPQ